MKSILKTALLIASLNTITPVYAAELTNLSPHDIPQHLAKKALVIDIRTPREWENTGIIPNSHPVTFFDSRGNYNAEQWLAEVNKLKSSPDQEIILVCRSGVRSGRAGHYLSQTLNLPNISHLKNGMNSWLRADLPTEKSCTAIKNC